MTADWRAETKPCAHCGAPFGPRLGESRARWATHRYCSSTCSHHESQGPRLNLTCAQCGALFWTGDRGQRFCRRACVVQWWQNEHARQRREMRDG
jgi:hypothetical protein